MLKKRILFLFLCFIFIFSSNTIIYATESDKESILEEITTNENSPADTELENVGWIRLTCTVPDGFPGTVKVVLYEVNKQEEIPLFLRSESEYSCLEPLSYGTYKISTVVISGGAEGCFETGYSEESFVIDSNTKTPLSVPIYIGIAEEMQTSNDNKYAGMTYAEIMADLNNNSIPDKHSADRDDTSSKEDVIFNADNEEEYYEQVEEYVKENTSKKEETKKDKTGIMVGFGFMLFLLAGLGVLFYLFKKNRDL